jgi:hypothetical protein
MRLITGIDLASRTVVELARCSSWSHRSWPKQCPARRDGGRPLPACRISAKRGGFAKGRAQASSLNGAASRSADLPGGHEESTPTKNPT